MKNMTLENIARACGGILIGGGEKTEVQGVVSDSRQVKEGYLFLAIKGEKVDGHDFILQVMKQGAAAAVCEKAPAQPTGPYILAENVLRALQDIAAFYRSGLDIPVIGITGSVGKTSTKECIAGILEQKYHVLKTAGNFNNEIGVPLTLLRIREEHEAAVLEMGINHFGEMHRLSRMVKPDIVVMTNIGECHLEFLGSRDGILKAKSEIFDFLQENGTVVINGDDDKLATIKEINKKTPVTFGLSPERSFYAEGLESRGLLGTKARIHTPEGSFTAEIPLPGQHMVYNVLAGCAVGQALGLTTQEMQAGIASLKPTDGRSNLIKAGDKVLIDDCYNANPVSMCAAIDLLATADTRKVAILGDMFELGEGSGEMHAKVGRYAAEKQIDVIICVGAEAVKMAEAAGKNARHYPNREMLLKELEEMLEPGDTILVKASHGMGFAEIVEYLKK